MRATIVLLLLTGCLSNAQILERELRGLEGQPEASRAGYRDGCQSGYRAGGWDRFTAARDARRFDGDRQYRDAWEDGFRVCRTRALNS